MITWDGIVVPDMAIMADRTLDPEWVGYLLWRVWEPFDRYSRDHYWFSLEVAS